MRKVVEPLQEEAKENQQEGRKKGGGGRKSGKAKNRSVQKVAPSDDKPDARKTRAVVAKAQGTNHATVAKCEKILKEDPELAEKIAAGELSVTQAEREIKKKTIAKTVDWPEGKYRVICADPPWSYGNTQPDYHTEQRDH
jgi:hypothetical protein